MQRPEDTKALVRRATIPLGRMREMARDVASKEGFDCQVCSLGTRELLKGLTYI